MESLREAKQNENQEPMPEENKCTWKLTKGAKIGQLCGRSAIGHTWCNQHRQCNADLQDHKSSSSHRPSLPVPRHRDSDNDDSDEDDDISEVSSKIQRLCFKNSSNIEFVIKRKNVRIIIE